MILKAFSTRELRPSIAKFHPGLRMTAQPVRAPVLDLIGLMPLMDRIVGSREVAIALLDGTFVVGILWAKRGSGGRR
jgi:hypothetical protein